MARSVQEIEKQLNEVNAEIAKLQGKTYGNYSDAEIAQMYNLDPEAAKFFDAKQGRDKALTSKESIASVPKDRSMTVDQIRQQLRMWRETADRNAQTEVDPDKKELYRKEAQIYIDEAAKEEPSIQAATIKAQELTKSPTGPDAAASDWWNLNKPNLEAVKQYGINANGGIKELTRMKDDLKRVARAAGYTSLDSIIEKYVDGINKDMENTKNAENLETNIKQNNAKFALDMKEKMANLNSNAQKLWESDPDYIAAKAVNNALGSYNASGKDMIAKRKMVYDFIKSYNTGTVLDSEIISTLGSAGESASDIVNMIKSKVNLPSAISDEQANKFYSYLLSQQSYLNKLANAAADKVGKTTGVKVVKNADMNSGKPLLGGKGLKIKGWGK